MDLSAVYHSDIPGFITEIAASPEMQRLKDVGMNCGCEYSNYSHFRNIGTYSRYEHSVGVALIVWHFTGSPKQSIAGLLHDISTPVFAHVIDFLHGDHMKQEYTEGKTAEIIAGSQVITEVLKKMGLSVSDVSNYHMYPIADNDSPALSADRLEYTFGNLVNYGFGSEEEVRRLYSDLRAGQNERREEEIIFSDPDAALEFADYALKCSEVYVCDEDRYSMQDLAELVGDAVKSGVLAEDDLLLTEPYVIEKLCSSPKFKTRWEQFRSKSEIITCDFPAGSAPGIIFAKKRYIDPFITGHGRVTECFPEYGQAIDRFKNASQNYYVLGI